MQVNEIFFVGSNKYGQSGTGDKNTVKIIESPRSYDFGVFIKQVSCGYHHSALLTISGLVYTMGSNIHGTLGTSQEGINYSFSPILVEGLEGVSKIESGAFHLCALTEQGQVYSWGRGMDGQLGTGSNKNSNLAQRVQLEEEVHDISCGTNHTLLVTSLGGVYAFGNGIYGQLGTGNNKNQQRPMKIRLEAEITMVAAGENHSLFLTSQGVMYGTGDNTSGQVGIGNGKKYVLEPQRISNPQNVSIVQAAKFSACICEGQLYVWGGPTRQFTPYYIENIDMCFTELKTGNDSLMVLSSKGELYSWQANIADSGVDLKRFVLRSNAILDFSIGENHLIILGDIVRTVQEKQISGDTLKCHESETPQLKEISKVENHTNSRTGLRQTTDRDSSANRPSEQSLNIADKQNRKPVSPFRKDNAKGLGQKTNTFFEESAKHQQTKSLDAKALLTNTSHVKASAPGSQNSFIQEMRMCRREIEGLRSMLTESKSVATEPTKNLNLFSRHRETTSVPFREQNTKPMVAQLREKDFKICQLQQELSKKQTLLVTYEGTIETLQRLIDAQSQQLECLRLNH